MEEEELVAVGAAAAALVVLLLALSTAHHRRRLCALWSVDRWRWRRSCCLIMGKGSSWMCSGLRNEGVVLSAEVVRATSASATSAE